MKRITVSKQPGADFSTLQEAFDSLGPQGGEILLKSGVYEEKVRVYASNVTLLGENRETTIVTYGDNARKLDEDGVQYGTFRSYTFYVGADDFSARNITFVNSAGPGQLVGQALALYADADRVSFFNCAFDGHQDTVFLSPLPPSPVIPGSFSKAVGKREPTKLNRSYFEDCTIRGDVDFIFGGGVAFFENCDVFSNDRGRDINGFITAASTPEGFKWGYVFNGCRLLSGCAPGSVYLGRPWRNYAKTAFISCEMSAHIHEAGWHNWDKPESEQTTAYEEFGSTGPGGSPEKRASWAKMLTAQEAAAYTVQNVLAGPDGWNPVRSE